MRSALRVSITAMVTACAGAENFPIPRCLPTEALPLASADCAATPEVTRYREDLAHTLLNQLRWEHSESLPLRAEVDASGSVDTVCVAGDVTSLGWSVRRQIARSNSALQATPPGPACVAGTSLDLTDALVRESRRRARTADGAESLASCALLRASGDVCIQQHAPVCAVFPNGDRRTYSNACDACKDSFVGRFLEGACTRL